MACTRPRRPRRRRGRPGLLLLLALACGRAPEQAKGAPEQAKGAPAPTDTRTRTTPAPTPGGTTPEPVSGAANPGAAATPEPHQNPPGGAPGSAAPTNNLGDVTKQDATDTRERK